MDKLDFRFSNAVCYCIWQVRSRLAKSRNDAPPGGLHLLNTRMQAVPGPHQQKHALPNQRVHHEWYRALLDYN